MTRTILQHLQSVIPSSVLCNDCPRATFKEDSKMSIKFENGDVFCGLMEEVVVNGQKECGINVPGVKR